MRFYLLTSPDAVEPAASFEATGALSWRNALAGIAGGGRYIVAADFNRPMVLIGDEQDHVPAAMRNLYTISTQVGVAGAANANHVWPRILTSIAATAEYMRQLRGLSVFASAPQNLRVVGKHMESSDQ